MNKNVLIVVPAYNEGKSITAVIEEIRQKIPEYDFVVVSDGSSDDTVAICRNLNVSVLDLPVNLGLSGAFGCGMKYAYKKGYDTVVQIDGDGQHDPVFVLDMVKKMAETDCNIVIGSRYLENTKPTTKLRGFGGKIITVLIKVKTGVTIKDPTSGMRLYDRKVIEMFQKDDFCEPEPHTLAYLLKNGFKIEEIPVTLRTRESGKSYLNGIKATRYMFRVCLSIILV